MVFCNGCGKPNPEGAKFCNGCGNPVNEGSADSFCCWSKPRFRDDSSHRPADSATAVSAEVIVGREAAPHEEVISPGSPSTVKFKDLDLERVTFVPCLNDWDECERRACYWSHREYAQIRNRQQKLILAVLAQVHDYPSGVVPPPIPGESRRGLGICCEPGTADGRASRVAYGRHEVVAKYRQGCDDSELAAFASSLSSWAAKNARDVGEKDFSATSSSDQRDFSRTFFLHGSLGSSPPLPSAEAAGARSVSETNLLGLQEGEDALRRMPLRHVQSEKTLDHHAIVVSSEMRQVQSDKTLDNHAIVSEQHVGPSRATRRKFVGSPRGVHAGHAFDGASDDYAVGFAAEPEKDAAAQSKTLLQGDGGGLASMVRCDSLCNLSAAGTQHLAHPKDRALLAKKVSPGVPPMNGGGGGLASMLRSDSLSNLAAAGVQHLAHPKDRALLAKHTF